MTEINVPLLRKTLEHITAHPEEHSQAAWAEKDQRTLCGTTYCLAGHAVQFAGYEIDWETPIYSADCVVGGESIELAAQRELGLTDPQARRMFNFRTNLLGLWEQAAHYTCGEIKVPERFSNV